MKFITRTVGLFSYAIRRTSRLPQKRMIGNAGDLWQA